MKLLEELWLYLILGILVLCYEVEAKTGTIDPKSQSAKGARPTPTSKDGLRKFPDHILFGSATAAYQVEGAWNEDGKSENIWDYYTHKHPCATKDCRNGDVATNSYHNLERDVEMMRELGLDFYRFSLSWTRILPTGFPDQINALGVAYYNKLINEMLKYNIQPVVTIYHWDLPQKLQLMGGWLNPHAADWFSDFAKVAFELFGDRVKYWVTINEPNTICYSYEYGTAVSPVPALGLSGHGWYLCSKTVLLAHAKAWHIYNDKFRSAQKGLVGISTQIMWFEPESESDNQIQAAEDRAEFEWGIFDHPIFSKEGDFPSRLKAKIAARSIEQGFPRSRLPELTADEITYIKGTADYFGLNHYTTQIIYRNDSVYGVNIVPSLKDDLEVGIYQMEEWPATAASWLKLVPWGFYKTLIRITKEYDNIPIFVTENGYPSTGGLNDDDRIGQYRQYLDALLDAVEDGCNVIGYTAWSLMDNFEWKSGYTERFGLYEVDFERSERTRTPRRSAFVYKQILRTRTLDPYYVPDTTVMSIDEGH